MTQTSERHATWLELFFDLVFVVSLGQMALRLEQGLAWGEFLALFLPVWWMWVSHTFYATRFDRDEPLQRLGTVAQMGAIAFIGACVGRGMDQDTLLFTAAFLMARIILIALYAREGVLNPSRKKLTTPMIQAYSLGALPWVIGLTMSIEWQPLFWILGILIDLVAPQKINRATQLAPVDVSHLPERFGLLVIIVLGEGVVGLIGGLTAFETVAPAILALAISLLVLTSVWWLYFGYVSRTSYACTLSGGQEYTLLHFPLVVGVFTLGLGQAHIVSHLAHGHSPELTTLFWGLLVFAVSFHLLQIRTLPPRELPALSVLMGCFIVICLGGLWKGGHGGLGIWAGMGFCLALLCIIQSRLNKKWDSEVLKSDNSLQSERIYSTDQVEVRFDRRTCIHSGVCLASLPEVFDLDRRPWIQPENADSEKLLEAVALCPSGALQARKLT